MDLCTLCPQITFKAMPCFHYASWLMRGMSGAEAQEARFIKNRHSGNEPLRWYFGGLIFVKKIWVSPIKAK